MTHTSRSIKYFKNHGYHVGIVERFIKIPGGGYRKDLFNIIDLIVLTGVGIVGVQSCGESFSAHDKKILAEPMAVEWLKNSSGLTLIGWRKLKVKRGGQAFRWTPRLKNYSQGDFR